MIEFGEVKIHNFMSIGEANVNLATGGFTLISAVNNRVEDSAKSNGSGKSSIGESIVWVLTGETIRGHKEVVNRYTEGNCLVELFFSYKGHKWAIKRSMSRSKEKSLEIVKDGLVMPSKGYRDACEVLSKELPELTFKFLNSVVILGQGLPGRFTNNSPSGRKAVLEELTNADYMINHVKEGIKNRAETLNNSLRISQDKKLSDSAQKSTLEKTLEVAKDKLDQLRAFDVDSEKERLNLLMEQGKEEADKNSKLASVQDEVRLAVEEKLNKINKVNEEYNSQIREVENLLRSDLQLKVKEIYGQRDIELETVNLEKIKLDQEIREVGELLEHNKAITSGGICKTCGQKLPSANADQIEKAKKEISKLEFEKSEISKKLTKIADDRSEISEKYKDLVLTVEVNTGNEISLKTGKFKAERDKELEQIEVELASLRSKAEKISILLKDSSNRLVNLRSEYKLLSSNISRNETDLVSYQNTVGQYMEQIKGFTESIEQEEEKIIDCQERLKVVKQMETFTSRDFRGILLEEVIQRLDLILKGYSEKVYGNTLTKFYQEGNSIIVEFDGKEYESLSGGEQQKINVLLQLSLRDLIIEIAGVTGSFLLLDEVFDGLDYQGCEKMISLFQTIDTSVFVITHHQELDIPYDYQLTVIKDESGIASIQVQ